MTANEIVNLIKNADNYFTLKLQRDNETVSVSLKNEKILSPSIEYNLIEDSDIGYIYIENFSKTLDVQMEKALKKLENKGMKSLIIDLRDNTGGYLDIASKVTSMFMEKGKKIYSLSYKNEVTHYFDETTDSKKYNIIVLINENTASASEIMAAALKESYGAKIIGKKSFGKGKVQQTMELEDGSMIKYTSAYWLTPVGTCIDEIGITPDYLIENQETMDEDGNITGILDHQLEKAISILKGEL